MASNNYPPSPWFVMPEQLGRGPLLADAGMPLPEQGPPVEPPSPRRVASIQRPQVRESGPEMAPRPPSLMDQLQEGFSNRESNISSLEQRMAGLPEQDARGWQSANLQPLMALSDRWAGGNTAAGYQVPKVDQTLRQKLQEQIAKEKNGLSDDKMKLMESLDKQRQFAESLDEKRMFRQAYQEKNRDSAEIAAMRAGKEKAPTAGSFAAAGYAKRLQQSDEIFQNLEGGGYTGPSRLDQLKAWGPNELRDPRAQQYDQATRNFINATLRRESGAAIAPSEFENAKQQYLPQPGDDKDTRAFKQANRRQVLESMKAEGGGAFDKIPYQSPSKAVQAADVKSASATVQIRAPDGNVYEVPVGESEEMLRAGGKRVN